MEQNGKEGNLISRQAAIEVIEKESQVDGAYGYMDTKSIVDLLNDLPTAQPEIIQCKDCKHWYDAPATDGYNSCELDALIRHKDFYCANAERRSE